MCGIVGVWLKNESAVVQQEQLLAGISAIKHRGPDVRKIKINANVGLAHARLSIMDLSELAHQPMTDNSGRYTLIFNGEIYNSSELRNKLSPSINYKTDSDSEVLLYFLIEYGLEKLNDLNGFFSFVLYDNISKEMIFARDRYGIKPLLIYEDKEQIIISSELAPFFQFNIDSTLSSSAINHLFQYTYIPGPESILKNAKTVLPGHSGTIKNGVVHAQQYYDLFAVKPIELTYEEAKKEVKAKLELAVQRRLAADVPLGTFLSGGVDSSIVSLIAKQYKSDLKTFSVGFDVGYFDESKYAKLMAKNIGSDHHQIQLTQTDFKEKFHSFLELNHQPFADSSSFAVFLLSEKTKEYVTVCLSGDGADELFGGYRKHEAEFKIRRLPALKKFGVKLVAKLGENLPKGRHGKWIDLNRRLQKVAIGLKQSATKRYENWLRFIDEEDTKALLKGSSHSGKFTMPISDDLNSVLLADQSFVLTNDMLTKVDRMSMAHGLEVRVPFLDHELVNYVNSLPSEFKINKNGRKQILIDAFKDQLPAEIYDRKKKGFEIPIFDWLKDEISQVFSTEIFSESYIGKQNIFNYEFINSLKSIIKSDRFGDRVHLIWTLIVFQNWWNKNICQ
ncbi:MAG: asparagine synthase (glutamine-hydrolyzing) [Crocinitomicaceae bacterium]